MLGLVVLVDDVCIIESPGLRSNRNGEGRVGLCAGRDVDINARGSTVVLSRGVVERCTAGQPNENHC